MKYVTLENEMLDEICFRYYGTEKGTVEKVLALNKHVAELPLLLPEGVEIELPSLEAKTKEMKLWE